MSIDSARVEASRPLGAEDIREVLLSALRTANLSRDASSQLTVSADAPIFGPDSPLDSLGLVALLLDIEDELAARGYPVTLSDDRAMSQKRSPFRSVETLVEYIQQSLQM
jgi:acyl carrier protein